MIIKIVMIFTILSIFGEYTSIKCANDISEYMEQFNMNTFDEFNLVCYASMYGFIQYALSYMHYNQGPIPQQISYLIQHVGLTYSKLLQVNGWFKYLLRPSPVIIQLNYRNIIDWTRNPNDAESIKNAVKSMEIGIEFNPDVIASLVTPKAKTFFEIFSSQPKKENLQLIRPTFIFCKNAIETLTKQTRKYFTEHVMQFLRYGKVAIIKLAISYGCIILLMTADEFNYFTNSTNENQILYFIRVIDEAVRDMFNGIQHILNVIDISNISLADLKTTGTGRTEIDLLKMIIPALQSVFNVSILINLMINLQGVTENIPTTEYSQNTPFIISDDYFNVTKQIKNTLASKFQQIKNVEQNQSIMTNKGKEIVTEGERSGSSLLSDGRLFRDERVFPSIIKYYAVFEESWENEKKIDYSNMDNRKVFLMELYAWSKMFQVKSRELLDLQGNKGVREDRYPNRRFRRDYEFISSFQQYFS